MKKLHCEAGHTVANLAINLQKKGKLKIFTFEHFLHELLINVLTHLSHQKFFRKLVIFNYILPIKVTVVVNFIEIFQ